MEGVDEWSRDPHVGSKAQSPSRDDFSCCNGVLMLLLMLLLVGVPPKDTDFLPRNDANKALGLRRLEGSDREDASELLLWRRDDTLLLLPLLLRREMP